MAIGSPRTRLIVLRGNSGPGTSTVAMALTVPVVRCGEPAQVKGDVVGESWYQGLAAMVRRGAFMILDEAFLTGGAGQRRLQAALGDLDVLWAGVRCDPLVAADREAARPDRIAGMARTQAVSVHAGVVYDVEVDTTRSSAFTCAHGVAEAGAVR